MRIFPNFKLYNHDQWWRFFIRLSLIILLFVIFTQKIELSVIDLGRHLENGRQIFQSPDVLFKNFYSYTEPEHEFINHHWLSGVIFYFLYFLGGFKLLTIFNLLLALAIFFTFFKLAENRSNFYLAAALSLPTILLMNERTEIRPEMFSYLLLAITWLILESKKLTRDKRLKILLPLFIFWANIHIYFFLGLALVGFYLAADLLKGFRWADIFSKNKLLDLQEFKKQFIVVFRQNKKKLIDFFLLFGAGLINPYHFKGLFYPFNIFKNYGYEIVENKSIFFLEKIILDYNFIIFRLVLAVLIFSLIANYLFQNKILLKDVFIGLFFSLLGLFAIRNLAIFALVALVIICANLYPALVFLREKIKLKIASLLSNFTEKYNKYGLIIFKASFILVFLFSSGFLLYDQDRNQIFLQKQFGIGLVEGSEEAFNYFKENNLSGPIFNNYDSGSALIYGLADREKVFVDNRPEAFSVDFFQEEYLPMQTDQRVWEEMNEKYNFKTIIFSHADGTPWARTFLKNILLLDDWALIYFDRYYLILVKKDKYSTDFIDSQIIDTWNFRQRLRNLTNNSNIKNKFNLASLAIIAEQRDLAEEIYRQIIMEKPNNARAYFALGNLYGASSISSDLYKAIDYTLRGLEIEPNMPGSYNHLGNIYWSLSDYLQAEHYWRLSLKKNHRDEAAKDYLKQLADLKKRGLLPR